MISLWYVWIVEPQEVMYLDYHMSKRNVLYLNQIEHHVSNIEVW